MSFCHTPFIWRWDSIEKGVIWSAIKYPRKNPSCLFASAVVRKALRISSSVVPQIVVTADRRYSFLR